jgi:precorrin-3B synthase
VPSSAPADRERVDACPGALTLHEAADGGLARVRAPGGLLTVGQFRAVTRAAVELGDGRLELTSRANLQIRALAPGAEAELGRRLAQAGLLPSASHERVRNIVMSPLSGISGGRADLTGLVAELDRRLCAVPELSELPGRFLFGLDDGRGDIAALGPDVLLLALEDSRARLLPSGYEVVGDDIADAMLALAGAFLRVRSAQGSKAWRMSELEGGAAAVTEAVFGTTGRPSGLPARPAEPIGRVGRRAAVVAAPLGRLDADQAEFLAESASSLRITPWRSIVVLDPAPDFLAAAGDLDFGVDAASPWRSLSACAGRPGCAKALADVQADARADGPRWRGRRVHFSGCERRCGRPADTEVDVLATDRGYEISE